ncbi:site-specific integrase [Virgibacillus salarius]|uniref:site-specific integrase n=1 Tax=Virgibacillus salarius TaxID=447199 RepID=UPI0031DA065F
MTRKDFNFKKNTISINKTWGYMKRNTEGFAPTKNEQSIRVIKIDQRTMAHFKKLFQSTPDNIHQLVFYSPNSKYKVISNTNANKLLKKLLINLKINPITMHGLRHTHASVLLYKKVSIYYVSERLGHGDIETTLREYSHVVRELRVEDEAATTATFENMVV